jgi:hypothetical protein
VALSESDTPGTPDWWLLRLGRALEARRPKLVRRTNYYEGDHPLPVGPRGISRDYLEFLRKARTNFCQIAADAPVHRLALLGVTNGQGDNDSTAWGWWKRNRMGSKQKQLFRCALSTGWAYVMVGAHPSDPHRPLITAEHPSQVITECDPATGETIALLKAWYDDLTGRGRALVCLPDVIVRYETEQRSGRLRLPWGQPNWTPVLPDPETNPGESETNPYGRVMGVPFMCRPQLGQDPRAEFSKVTDIQDRINSGVLDRMTAQRYSAWRQKWVTGHKFSKKTDPETGLETVDQPFIPGPGTVWASEGTETRFGEYSQTDLLGFLKTHESDIRDLLILTNTPAYYVASELVNLSADAVVALDTTHVAKVLEHQAFFGEDFGDVFDLASLVAGVDEDPERSMRWQDARHLNPTVVANMGVQLKTIGYPLGMTAERMGEPPDQVDKLEADSAAASLLATLTSQPPPTPPAAGQPQPTQPPVPVGAPANG